MRIARVLGISEQAVLGGRRNPWPEGQLLLERGGLLAQLPSAVRERLTAEAETARGSLHALLGGRDPIRVSVVVNDDERARRVDRGSCEPPRDMSRGIWRQQRQ